ncbi:MAG: DUF2971 domain-containing protein [Bacteroidales bacterium]|nr:DUF2971 domain-containing protein [Bacteroidales bacterium]
MEDLYTFVEACVNHPDHAYSNREFYNKIRSLELNDYRLYFMKAACEYHLEESVEVGITNVKRAISMWNDGVKVYNREIDLLLLDNKAKGVVCHPDFFYRFDNKYYKIYLLAAQFYARAGMMEKCKGMYNKYYYYAHKVNVDSSLLERESFVVYSFRKFSIYSLQDLAKGEVTLVRPDKMNDPFDSLANYIAGNPERLKRTCKQMDHVKTQSDCFKHFYIRCFRANRKTYETDDSILQDKLMWSYYTEGHQGFCIKYRIDKSYFNQFDDSKLTFTKLIPVKYNKEKKEISIYEALNTSNSFALKDKCWEPENEVRLLHFSPNCEENHYSIKLDEKTKLEEIIFGINCNSDARELIAKSAPSGCKLFEMTNDEEKDIYTLIKKEYKQYQ